MKHLIGFSQLNEAKQDGLEIMDAIINTPEGKDLTAAISIPGLTLADLFEPKNTGRVWIRGTYGSKSYIEKINGVYSLISLSNGKIFAQEDYNTIKECLRRAWSNAVGKKATSIGLKKKDYREWLETNIEPGQELTPDEILLIYKEKSGTDIPDLMGIINNSSVISIIKLMFPSSHIMQARGQNSNESGLNLSFYDSPLLFCNSEIPYPHNEPRPSNIGIRIQTKMKKSSKLTYRNGSYLIEIGTVNSINNLDKLLREWITGAILGLKPQGIPNFLYKSLKKDLFSICPLLEESMLALFSGDNITSADQEVIWDKIADNIIAKGEPTLISKAKNSIPQLWDKIEKKMGGRRANLASDLGDLGF